MKIIGHSFIHSFILSFIYSVIHLLLLNGIFMKFHGEGQFTTTSKIVKNDKYIFLHEEKCDKKSTTRRFFIQIHRFVILDVNKKVQIGLRI